MTILYPNEVEDIYILGTKFTGNVVSVGSDGNYAYDYNNPRVATVSEPNGTLVLIYPGTYSMYNNNNVNNKDVLWRGMGDLPIDVSLTGRATSYYVLRVYDNYDRVILENLGVPNSYARSSGAVIYFEDGSLSTNVYVNKGDFTINAAYFSPQLFGFKEYNGNAFITYSRIEIDTGKESHYGYVGYNASAVYKGIAMEYDRAYKCYACSGWETHIYNVGPAENYGYNYGKYLIQFVSAPDLIIYQKN